MDRLALIEDPVAIAERRLFAARVDYRDALDTTERARAVLLAADRELRRLRDGIPLGGEHPPR